MSLTEAEGLTIEDLEAMPDDGRRYELLGGSIVVNAAPRPRHQVALAALLDGRHPQGEGALHRAPAGSRRLRDDRSRGCRRSVGDLGAAGLAVRAPRLI